jgi:hypothetical protein
MKPLILDRMVLASCGFVGCLDWMRIAVLSTTVEMAFNPATLIVSPDSTKINIRSQFFQTATIALTYEINDPVCDSQGTGRFDAAAHIFDRRGRASFTLPVSIGGTSLQLVKVFFRKIREARHDILPQQFLGFADISLVRDLDLEFAFPKSQIKNLFDSRGIRRRHDGLVLKHLVPARNPKIHTALANEGGDVSGREENDCHGEVLDEGDIEAIAAVEDNV